jgi:hypothetical protein
MNTRGIAAPEVGPIVVDLETAPIAGADAYLDPVQADKRLKDPEKVKADLEEKERTRLEKLALDWNVGRIVALAWWTASGEACHICQTEEQEADALRAFWMASRNRMLIGYNIKNFDGPYLIQRSRYLGVRPGAIDLNRYSQRGCIDIFNELTFNDCPASWAMRRTLSSFARRFGIPVTDDVGGAEVPALVAAGEWDKVRQHVTSDVQLTVALAQRLGVVRVEQSEAVAI